jgi:hypothetical protein
VRAPRPVVPILAAIALAIAALMGSGPQVAHAGNSATLTIVRPGEGPVGARIFINVQGAASSQQYNLGYAQQTTGCAPTPTLFTNGLSFTTDHNGNDTGSFIWPPDSATGSFYLCAQSPTQPSDVIQSATVYKVDSASAPAISLARAAAPTPTPGGAESTPTTPVPTATPEPDGVYTVGEGVVISGSSFMPGGSALAVSISGDQNSLGDTLPLANGDSTFNSDTSGAFQVTVTLPGYRTGQAYLHVTTTDGPPPTLRADSQAITVNPAPSPTPTPTVTPSPTPSAKSTPCSSGSSCGSGNGDVPRIVGIAGLGSLSVLLLMVGTILLVSAGTMRREG